MAKKDTVTKVKVTKEEKIDEKKQKSEAKLAAKEEAKLAKQQALEELKKEKEANKKKKEDLAKEIKNLKQEVKSTKDKTKKKELKKQIKDKTEERNDIGARDNYFRDVRKEMKLVRFPNGAEVTKYSLAALIFVLFFAAFFFGIDVLFALVKGLFN